jgi:Cu(I)/Ag(I) efflux system membrane fusion protein
MKHAISAIALAAVIGVGTAVGYWYEKRPMEVAAMADESVSESQSQASDDREVLYYRDPRGKPYYSPVPKKDSMGMDYIPVYEDDESQPALNPPQGQQAAVQPPASKGKILYYRNPMGLPDTSPTPKKDPMGMDYIPIYEGEDDGSTVKVSLDKVQRLGVRTEPAALRELHRTVRAVGTIQVDERRQAVVTTKFEGFIEKLHVNATGQVVRGGEPLLDFYAPELVAAQQEYLLAWHSLHDMAGASADVRSAAQQIANAALQRLRNWDISDDQVKHLQRSGTFTRTLSLRSPADGVVLEKGAVEGMRFAPGDALYRIADLSTVWLIADVFEQDLAAVREGQPAKLTVAAYPGTEFTGKVAFIYPTVARETRTAKVRVEVPNPDGRLKIDMYGNVELTAPVTAGTVVAVPDSAVLNSGARQAVLVDRGEGRFEPREVKLGAQADGFTEIRSGLKAGEPVVVAANFLIDAESNLRAALRSFTADDQSAAGGAK